MTDEISVKNQAFSKVVPVNRFILLSILTFGFYELIWIYKSWVFLQRKDDLKISPLARTIFAPITIADLTKRIKNLAKERGIFCEYSAFLIAVIYFTLSVLVNLADPYWLLSVFTFLPLLPLVKTLNEYHEREFPNLPQKKFAWWQILLITILGIWTLAMYSSTLIQGS